MAHSQVTHDRPQTDESNGTRYSWTGLRMAANPKYEMVVLNGHHLESLLLGPSILHTLRELAKTW